jgi:transcriptional regulator GlxA family with amidase domain
MIRNRNLGILLFDDVEVLDFCGPFEVFSVTTLNEEKPFNVFTVAESKTITARNGLSVNATYTPRETPHMDLFLVPGGLGTRREVNNAGLIQWIGEHASEAELTLSVCTGALLLGRAGMLDGLESTTHHGAFDLLRQIAPNSRVREDRRIVDNGKVILSAGISAGIDMSFYVVAKLLGEHVARQTAQYMEYAWNPSEIKQGKKGG